MNRITIVLLGVIFSLIVLIVTIQNDKLRCSSLGSKIVDNILNIEAGTMKCEKLYYTGVLKNPDSESISFIKEKDYSESIRFNNISSKIELDCPTNSDIIVIIGQSNSANHGLSKIIESNKDLNFFNNNCYSLSEPVLGATGRGHSITSSLSSKIKNKKPIIFLTNGWGGTSIKEWSIHGSVLTTYANENIKELVKNNNLKYVIWIQGESDKNNSGINYIKHFENFKKQLFKSINPEKLKDLKIIVTQTSICGYYDTSAQHIVSQQKKLGEIYSNVIVTNVSDNLDLNFRHDGCHFNVLGIERITDEISEIINKSY